MIPKILLQISKDPYPQYVKDMWQKRTDESWLIDWFDDAKIMQFFDDNPLPEFPNIKEVFWSFEDGAHRSDLFRYYYLYLNGGIFVDSDAMAYTHLNELIKPEIDYFFPSSNGDIRGTLLVGQFESAMFNGFFGCVKNSNVLYQLLRDAYLTKPSELKQHYLRFMCMMEERVKHENPLNAEYFKFDHNDTATEGFVYDNSGKMICRHYHYSKIVPHDNGTNTMNRKEHIAHLYRVILGREPDFTGSNNYLNSNLDLYQIQQCLWQSDEFKSRFNTTSFIETTPLENKLPIFIVNLERRPDKKQLIESRLANLGIKNYEIIKAVDGKELPENLDGVYDKESAIMLWADLARSEIACALSHIEIAKKIINQNLDYAVILEDDVELTADFKNLVKDFNLEKDKFDFLLLGWSSSNEFFNGKLKNTVAPYNLVNKNGSISYLDKTEFNIGSIGIHKAFYPSLYLDYINGAYGYVMSNAGARKLLEFNYPVKAVSDHVIVHHIDKFKTLFTTSMIVHTQLQDSDIAYDRSKIERVFSNLCHSRINCPDYGT